ncbi:hypothetical protein RF55_19668 [Lasius niger]|nr:hypothetical protein RF55_19668 [Lasius niger]
MQSLKLPERETIHLLIDGISNNALRGTGTALKVESVDEFLEQMHLITTSFSSRKTNIVVKPDKVKNPGNLEVTSDKDTSSQKPNKDLYCVYCRAKGHIRTDCYKQEKRAVPPIPPI